MHTGLPPPHAPAMTSTSWPVLPPALRRRRDDRVFRGVCAALGRATGTDPVLWRVTLGVLALFGGGGLFLYVAGWLLIPEDGDERSVAERLLARRSPHGRLVALALVVAAALTLTSTTADGRGLAPLVLVGLLGYLVLRRAPGAAAPPPVNPGVPSYGPAQHGPAQVHPGLVHPGQDDPVQYAAQHAPAQDGQYATAGYAAVPYAGAPYGPPGLPDWYAPLPDLPPEAPRSPLGLLTVSVAALAAGLLLVLDALGVGGITAPRVLAVGLLVVGGGLVVGSVWGRSRGLLVLGAVLGLSLGAAGQVDGPPSWHVGTRTVAVTQDVELDLSIGESRIDLGPLVEGTATDPVEVRVRQGVGSVVVLVPEGLDAAVAGEVGLGSMTAPGEEVLEEGSGVSAVWESDGTGREVRVEVRLGLGELEVRDA